jgi:hypothetical protein
MNIRDFFEKTSSDWVRYSKYEIKEKDGREYITPAADSKIELYNPLDSVEDLVVNALNVGMLLCIGELDTQNTHDMLISFAQSYGLLGFMTAIPLNGNFMEYPHVYFGRNAFFDVDMMETREYLQLFQPFGIKEGQPRDGFSLPVTLITGKTLEYSIVFSRNYSERTDWFEGILKEFYMHFAACKAYEGTDNPALKDAFADTISGFSEYGLGFRMGIDGKPTMIWDFNSLKMVIETIYAFLISAADTPLRMCKHCGKAFYAKHGRSEFCSGRCRNQFNVYKSRGKK